MQTYLKILFIFPCFLFGRLHFILLIPYSENMSYPDFSHFLVWTTHCSQEDTLGVSEKAIDLNVPLNNLNNWSTVLVLKLDFMK